MKATRALEALNFFVADVQAGIGPFLGVFLQARGWGTDQIGTVMTIGGIAGMVATSPAGALVDSIRHKRALIVVAGAMTVAASQVATAITGAALGPAMAGITLGIVRQHGVGFAVSTGSLILWLSFGAGLRHVCGARGDFDSNTVDARPAES